MCVTDTDLFHHRGLHQQMRQYLGLHQSRGTPREMHKGNRSEIAQPRLDDMIAAPWPTWYVTMHIAADNSRSVPNYIAR